MEILRYITPEMFLEINAAAIREKRSRSYDPKVLKDLLSSNDMFFSVHEFLHKMDEMRVGFSLDNGSRLYIDMSVRRYKGLPIAYINEAGDLVLESKASWLERQPYPNGRKWSEKVEMKPVRDSTFPRKVKAAYKNQCAMCSISDSNLLIAAHIVPVNAGGTDDVSNGLCLCRNHDILYERGAILVRENGEIIINSTSDVKVEYTKIRYPLQQEYYPSPGNLDYRMNMSSLSKIKTE